MRRSILFAVSSLALPGFAFAAPPVSPVLPPAPVSASSNFATTSGQYYDASVSGLGDFMERLQQANPEVHRKLQPRYEALRSRRNWALAGAGAGALAGFGLTYAAIEPNSSGTAPILFSALTGIAAGGLIYWIAAPGRTDILEFINDHNSLDPRDPLKFQLGLGFVGGAPALAMSIAL